MRAITGLLIGTAAAGGASYASAQSASEARALFSAPFAAPAAAPAWDPASETPAALTGPAVSMRSDPEDAGAFALPVYAGTSLDQSRLLSPDQPATGGGLVVWRSNEVSYGAPGGAVDSLRLSVGGVARAPGGVVMAGPNGLLDPDAQAFDVDYTRGWPSAFRMNAGRFGFDLSPHAGFGVSSVGGSAEAGAMLRVGSRLGDAVAQRFGLHEDAPNAFAGRGHWYLFAAASGQAVGLNMFSGGSSLQRPGWSTEPSSALVGDAQAGVGWSRGNVQASFGYVHREVRGADPYLGESQAKFSDSMVALSLSIHPH